MRWERQLLDRAETQEGLVARFQTFDLRVSSAEWRRALRSGRWERAGARVLRLRGAPRSDAQRVLAAVLDASPGAVLHGRSALAWFGLRGFDLRMLQVARPRGISALTTALAYTHRLREIRANDVTVARGIPTMTPLRAIWTEAARFGAPALNDIGTRRIGRLLDDAHVRGLVTWAALHESVEAVGKRGRAGSLIMRALAEDRRPDSSPSESRNEDRFEQIMGAAALDSVRRQVVLGGHEPIGRADYYDDEVALVVEVNSITYHSSPSDRRADRVRYQRFNDAGFTVAVVWEDDLWSDADAVVSTLRQARKYARNDHRVVLHTPSCPWPPDDPPVLGIQTCSSVADVSTQNDQLAGVMARRQKRTT
jgi:very-short-patch-repair endonuclease